MGDPVTQLQFYERMQQSDSAQIDAHARLRKSMEEGFALLRHELIEHSKEDRLVADRVLVIETQRADEAKATMKRGAWAGVLAAAALSGAIQAVKALLGK